jgi:xylose isomerase
MAHDTMAGLSFTHAVSQALWAGKLFHIDLNGQKIGRYDQDLRFGSVDLVESFHLVRLLESSGYQGPLHFDAHPYRTEDAEGVWDFAAGCMRTYRLLAEKARRLDADSEFRDALAVAGVADLATPTVGPYSSRMADGLRNEQVDLDQLRRRGYRNEHLDQLVTEVIMGTR